MNPSFDIKSYLTCIRVWLFMVFSLFWVYSFCLLLLFFVAWTKIEDPSINWFLLVPKRSYSHSNLAKLILKIYVKLNLRISMSDRTFLYKKASLVLRFLWVPKCKFHLFLDAFDFTNVFYAGVWSLSYSRSWSVKFSIFKHNVRYPADQDQ